MAEGCKIPNLFTLRITEMFKNCDHDHATSAQAFCGEKRLHMANLMVKILLSQFTSSLSIIPVVLRYPLNVISIFHRSQSSSKSTSFRVVSFTSVAYTCLLLASNSKVSSRAVIASTPCFLAQLSFSKATPQRHVACVEQLLISTCQHSQSHVSATSLHHITNTPSAHAYTNPISNTQVPFQSYTTLIASSSPSLVFPSPHPLFQNTFSATALPPNLDRQTAPQHVCTSISTLERLPSCMFWAWRLRTRTPISSASTTSSSSATTITKPAHHSTHQALLFAPTGRGSGPRLTC